MEAGRRFSIASSRDPMRPRFASTRGTVHSHKIGALQEIFERDQLDVKSSARRGEPPVVRDDVHSRRCASFATSDPTCQADDPQVLPRTSRLEISRASGFAAWSDASACGTQRATANSSAMVCFRGRDELRAGRDHQDPGRVAAATSMCRRRRPRDPLLSGACGFQDGAVTLVSLRHDKRVVVRNATPRAPPGELGHDRPPLLRGEACEAVLG